MRNKTSNQPDAFAWENMSKAQKILSIGTTLFVLTMMGKGCVNSQSNVADRSGCDSTEVTQISEGYIPTLEHYAGEKIDSQAELEFAVGLAAKAVEECRSN